MYCQPCPSCQEKLNRHLENISSKFLTITFGIVTQLHFWKTNPESGPNPKTHFRSITKVRPTKAKNENQLDFDKLNYFTAKKSNYESYKQLEQNFKTDYQEIIIDHAFKGFISVT